MLKSKFKIKKIILYIFASIISLIFLFPFIWVFFTSIKPRAEIYSFPLTIFPRSISLEHYVRVIRDLPEFILYFRNSAVITIITVVMVTLFATMGGYSLGRLKFFGNKFYLLLILLVISLPYSVYLVPVYIIESRFGLINSNLGLILPYIALNLPLALYIMRGTFKPIPSEIEDAAICDGCNSWQIWSKVLVPIAKPGIATTIIFTFIMVWQEFLFAVTLMPSARYQTLPVGIVNLRDEAQAWAYGTLSATIVLALIPVFVIFIVMRRYFLAGLTEGALKG